jgi:hypothetical protein
MAKPGPKKKRERKDNGQLPLPTSRTSAACSETPVLPMQLQIGDPSKLTRPASGKSPADRMSRTPGRTHTSASRRSASQTSPSYGPGARTSASRSGARVNDARLWHPWLGIDRVLRVNVRRLEAEAEEEKKRKKEEKEEKPRRAPS